MRCVITIKFECGRWKSEYIGYNAGVCVERRMYIHVDEAKWADDAAVKTTPDRQRRS